MTLKLRIHRVCVGIWVDECEQESARLSTEEKSREDFLQGRLAKVEQPAKAIRPNLGNTVM